MDEIAEKSSYVAPDDHDWSQYLGPEDLRINATIEGWKKDPKLYADPEIQQMVRDWDNYIRTPKNADDPRWEVLKQINYQPPKPVVAVDLMKQSRQRAAPTPPEPEKKKGFFNRFFKSDDDIRTKGIAQCIAERRAQGTRTGAYTQNNTSSDNKS